MIKLIMYFHKLFCKHEWELIGNIRLLDYDDDVPTGYRKTYRCKKCGYVQKIEI